MNVKRDFGFIAFSCGMFLLIPIVLTIALLRFGPPIADATQKQTPGKGKHVPSPDLPYPERKACINWLKENSPEPASLEIIKWEKREPRTEGPFRRQLTNGVAVTVKCRLRNVLGGLNVERWTFVFENGKLDYEYNLENRPTPGAVLRN